MGEPSAKHIGTYEPLKEVQSVISTLVENIYNDGSYQEYLKDLKSIDTTLSNKKLDVISKTFMDIRVFNTNKNPLFLANDIGVILGVSNINTITKNYTSIEKITGMVLLNDKLVTKHFLTKNGVYRIMFNNRSKLSDVFRAFIYKLLEYMETSGKDITHEIMEEINSENPEMVSDAMLEYNNNLAKYKNLYEIEVNEKKQLEIAIEANHILYKDMEDEKNEIEIKQNYSTMYIEQLKRERKLALKKIYDIKEDTDLDETHLALDFMKKKYLKEFTISLVHPDVISEIYTSKKYPVDNIHRDYTLGQYESDFNFIIEMFNISGKINEEETFYLTIALKSLDKEPVQKKELKDLELVKEVCIASDYINDKTKFLQMLEIIKTECEHYHMPGSRKGSNIFIYKISIEQIKIITRNLIIL